MKKIDRFCYRHPRFGIRNLMLYIVIGNVVVWLFSMIDTTNSLYSLLSFSPYHILQGQVWRLVSFALLPESGGLWALLFFYFYYFIGNSLEKEWGAGRFTIYVFSGMLLTVVYGFVLYFAANINYSISAQFIYLSLLFAFATTYPDMQVLLFFFIPIKMKWIGIANGVFFVFQILSMRFPYNLLPIVAVLNYLIFCGGWLFDLFRPRNIRQKQNTVNFKNEVRRINREQASKPYNRKCSVCGRTDTDYPQLEFRYCSKCAGYHCFCIDHINNHVHFTE